AGQRRAPPVCRATLGGGRDRFVEPPCFDKVSHTLAGDPPVPRNQTGGSAQPLDQLVARRDDFLVLGRRLPAVVTAAEGQAEAPDAFVAVSAAAGPRLR